MRKPTVAKVGVRAFDVDGSIIGPDDQVQGTTFGGPSIDKRLDGDVEPTMEGEMPSPATEVADSAGYLAWNGVGGAVQDCQGSVALQHSGTLNRGAPPPP
jgi:Protein of unknown function (DUF3224)